MGQGDQPDASAGVRVATIQEDQSEGRRVYDPKHPGADTDGYVTYSNVNAVDEMVNMITSQRAYETNSNVIQASDQMLQTINSLR